MNTKILKFRDRTKKPHPFYIQKWRCGIARIFGCNPTGGTAIKDNPPFEA